MVRGWINILTWGMLLSALVGRVAAQDPFLSQISRGHEILDSGFHDQPRAGVRFVEFQPSDGNPSLLEPDVPSRWDEGKSVPPSLESRSPSSSTAGMNEPAFEPFAEAESEWLEGHDGGLFWDHFLPTYNSSEWLRVGCWYTEVDGVMMLRSRPQRVTLSADTSLPVGPVLTTISGQIPEQGGMRATIGRSLGRDSLNRDHSLEFTFLGLFDWVNQAQLSSVVPGFMNGRLGEALFPVLGFANADVHSYVDRSSLDSYELNFRIRSRPGRDRMVLQPDGAWIRHSTPSRIYSILGGFRYVEFDDNFLFRSRSANPAVAEGDYHVDVKNLMFGLQMGGDFREQYGDWSWGIRGKVGAMVNFFERFSRVDVLEISSRQEIINDEDLVILGEVGLYGSYQLRPNAAIRVGYDVLYLEGLVIATNNLGLASAGFPSPHIHGNAVFQGLSVGLEMSW